MNIQTISLLLGIGLTGCVNPDVEPVDPPAGAVNAVMKPDTRVRARIESVNTQGQYVIVDFGLGVIPPLDTEMNVYRGEEVTGVVRLTGPIRGSIVAGDLTSGEAQPGDLVIVDEPPEKQKDGAGQ